MFYPETLEFIAENHWMSNREWFHEHKKEYEKYVRNPLIELTNELAPTVEAIDCNLITDPRTAISRINRDLRFARGGSIYRETLWISFRRDREAFPAWPEFYFLISPREFCYGCGYYRIKAEVIDEIRKLIIEGHPKFLEAKAALDTQSLFVLEGDCYKRSRYNDYPDDLKVWLDKKVIQCTCTPEGKELFSADLPEKIKAVFNAVKPVYDFLVYAEEAAASEKTE